MTAIPAQGNNRIGKWPYLWLILGVLALIAALLLMMRAHQIGQVESERLNIVSSQKVLAERISNSLSDVSKRTELGDLITQFDNLQTQSATIEGNLLYSVNSPSHIAHESDQQVAQAWSMVRDSLPDPSAYNTIGGGDPRAAPDFAPLRELSRTLIEWMKDNGSDLNNLEPATHLLQLAEAIEEKVVIGEDGSIQAERAGGAWLFYDQILNRLEVAVSDGELSSEGVGALIVELRSEFTDLDPVFNGPDAENASAASTVNPARRAEQIQNQSLLNVALENQTAALHFAKDNQQYWFRLGMIAALLSIAALCLGTLLLWRASRQARSHVRQHDKKNQDSILRLLDEISALAEGDLTTQATVSEDMTGAIADSVNYAVSELRRLVGAITNSADRVTVAVEETGSSAQQLAKASSVQSREIQRSATYLGAMAETMEQMSQRSMEAAQIAGQSVEKSVSGRRSVEKTVEGMGRIRSQILQTSGLLKRLDESSTQIGEIVGLINEVTSRSRLLALNSAIHSNSDTQQNHRFANIANEVQTLSSTLKEAAQEIGTLVNIIQDDAKAATESMNQTTTEVMQGSELAQSAGESLQNIESISRRLSVVVEHLSQKTRKQSDVVNQLSANMGVINDVTRRSSHGMQLSAAALEDLRHMATELRGGVAGFVLPSAAKKGGRKDDMVERPLLKKRELSHSDSARTAKARLERSSPDLSEPSLGDHSLTHAATQSIVPPRSMSATSRPSVSLVREKITTADG